MVAVWRCAGKRRESGVGLRRVLLTSAILLSAIALAQWAFSHLILRLTAAGFLGLNEIEFQDQVAQTVLGCASVVVPLLCAIPILRVLNLRVDFRLRPRRWPLALIGFIGTATPGLTLLCIAAYLGIWDPASLTPPFGRGELFAWAPLVLIFALMEVASEELMFRGILGAALEDGIPSRIIAIAATSALFALAHSQWDAGNLAARVILGMALGWATFRLAGIEYGIGAHYAINVLSMLVLPPFGIDDVFVESVEVSARETTSHLTIQVQAAAAYFVLIVAGAEVLRGLSKYRREAFAWS